MTRRPQTACPDPSTTDTRHEPVAATPDPGEERPRHEPAPGPIEQALIRLLEDGAAESGAAHQERLRLHLAEAAARRGLVDVVYRTVDTTLGALLLAATPSGLVRVAYAVEGHDRVLADLAERIGPRILRDPGRLDQAAHQIDEYLHHGRSSFDLPLDLRLAEGFRGTVLHHLQTISYGSTASYASIARAAGSPRAVRAVGTACARNPLPLVVPCHRVVRSDGSAGQYVGGAEVKRTLLTLESTPVGSHRRNETRGHSDGQGLQIRPRLGS